MSAAKDQELVASGTDRREFVFRSGRLCLDLVATLGSRAHLNLERLGTPADLDRWLLLAGCQGGGPPATHLDHRTALELREAVYELASIRLQVSGAQAADALEVVNRLANEPPLVPTLRADFSAAWSGGVQEALSQVARDAVDLFSGPWADRIRECSGPECTVLFVDTSRPGRRRWCSMEDCGNQAKSAGLRAKRREQASR